MTTTYDDEHLRDEFLLHPPHGVPGGGSGLPRRIAGEAAAAAVATPGSAVGDGVTTDDEGGERVVPELIHVPAPTPWAALEVTPDASWDEIRAAHRRLLIQWHPDRHVLETPAEQNYASLRLAEVNVAFSELRAGRRR